MKKIKTWVVKKLLLINKKIKNYIDNLNYHDHSYVYNILKEKIPPIVFSYLYTHPRLIFKYENVNSISWSLDLHHETNNQYFDFHMFYDKNTDMIVHYMIDTDIMDLKLITYLLNEIYSKLKENNEEFKKHFIRTIEKNNKKNKYNK